MIKKKFTIFVFLFINLFGNCYSETKPYSKLENDIAKNLRCLICQGQSIYDSNSEFALTIKSVVKDKISEGKNEKEIYDFLSEKYGDWILLNPPLKKNSYVLWFLPYFLFVLGIIFLFFLLKKPKIRP